LRLPVEGRFLLSSKLQVGMPKQPASGHVGQKKNPQRAARKELLIVRPLSPLPRRAQIPKQPCSVWRQQKKSLRRATPADLLIVGNDAFAVTFRSAATEATVLWMGRAGTRPSMRLPQGAAQRWIPFSRQSRLRYGRRSVHARVEVRETRTQDGRLTRSCSPFGPFPCLALPRPRHRSGRTLVGHRGAILPPYAHEERWGGRSGSSPCPFAFRMPKHSKSNQTWRAGSAEHCPQEVTLSRPGSPHCLPRGSCSSALVASSRAEPQPGLPRSQGTTQPLAKSVPMAFRERCWTVARDWLSQGSSLRGSAHEGWIQR
jgi:hypothetical protein